MKIGFLLPNSVFIPSVGKDLVTFFKKGLQDGGVSDFEVAIEVGGYNALEQVVSDKMNSLLLKDDVDLIFAPLNIGLYRKVAPIFDSSKIPLIANWLGEDLLFERDIFKGIFTHGLDQWQSAWMTGYHGCKTLGKQGVAISSIHDGGYGMSLASSIGIETAGGRQIFTGITHRDSRSEDPTETLKAAYSSEVDFTLGLYSSKEGVSFLNSYWALGHKNETLLGNSFMVEDDVLAEVGDKALGIQVTSNWNRDNDSNEDNSNEKNMAFRTWAKENRGAEPNAYALLAYESGLMAATAATRIEGSLEGNRQAYLDALRDVSVEGPRGAVSFHKGLEEPKPKEYLLEVSKREDGSLYKRMVKELEIPEVYYEQRDMARKNLDKQGWTNPYLIG